MNHECICSLLGAGMELEMFVRFAFLYRFLYKNLYWQFFHFSHNLSFSGVLPPSSRVENHPVCDQPPRWRDTCPEDTTPGHILCPLLTAVNHRRPAFSDSWPAGISFFSCFWPKPIFQGCVIMMFKGELIMLSDDSIAGKRDQWQTPTPSVSITIYFVAFIAGAGSPPFLTQSNSLVFFWSRI